MPLDGKTKKPVNSKKPGSLHFHMNLGSCFDSHIAEQMTSFVPKHKSYLKEADLAYISKPTKEQEDAANVKEKAKDGADIMFEQVTKDQKNLENKDRAIKVKVDCRRRKHQE